MSNVKTVNISGLVVEASEYHENTAAIKLAGNPLLYIQNETISKVIVKLQEYIDHLPTPHPHADLMEMYAKDAKETEKPWERWEWTEIREDIWFNCNTNPTWQVGVLFRRKRT